MNAMLNRSFHLSTFVRSFLHIYLCLFSPLYIHSTTLPQLTKTPTPRYHDACICRCAQAQTSATPKQPRSKHSSTTPPCGTPSVYPLPTQTWVQALSPPAPPQSARSSANTWTNTHTPRSFTSPRSLIGG